MAFEESINTQYMIGIFSMVHYVERHVSVQQKRVLTFSLCCINGLGIGIYSRPGNLFLDNPKDPGNN